MTYLLIYLTIGVLTFHPMLLWDKECAKHLSGLPWQCEALAFAMWTVVWALSIFYDLCDWLFPEDE